MDNEQIIYRHRLFELVDDYIDRDLNGREELLEGPRFVYMIEVIREQLPYISRDDADGLDSAFNAFVELCLRFGRVPSLMLFGRLIKMTPATMSRWKHGVFRDGSRQQALVEQWQATCEAIMVDSLANDPKTSVNKIFLLKSIYGYDDGPSGERIEAVEQKALAATELPKLNVNDD